jgi:hypothetical protein
MGLKIIPLFNQVNKTEQCSPMIKFIAVYDVISLSCCGIVVFKNISVGRPRFQQQISLIFQKFVCVHR